MMGTGGSVGLKGPLRLDRHHAIFERGCCWIWTIWGKGVDLKGQKVPIFVNLVEDDGRSGNLMVEMVCGVAR